MKSQYAWSQKLWCSSWLGLIASVVVITGCTSQPLVGSYVATKSACCSSIAEFKFHSIPLGQDIDFSITSTESNFPFSKHPEHFVAFKVPDDFIAATIQVKSYLSTDFLPKATAVIPDFIYLDANYLVIGKSAVTNMQEAGGFWGAAFSGRAQVPPKTRYIVVIAGDGSTMGHDYHSANGTTHHIPAAALGKLSLRLFGESVPK